MTSGKPKVVGSQVPAAPADRFSALVAAIRRWLRPADGVEIVSIRERDHGREAIVVLRRMPGQKASAGRS